jgi:hypothetical protein
VRGSQSGNERGSDAVRVPIPPLTGGLVSTGVP